MKKIDKVIKYFKNINEEGAPTMNTSTPTGAAGFSAAAPSPNAGIDTFLNLIKRKKNNEIDYRSVRGNYKEWLKNLKNK